MIKFGDRVLETVMDRYIDDEMTRDVRKGMRVLLGHCCWRDSEKFGASASRAGTPDWSELMELVEWSGVEWSVLARSALAAENRGAALAKAPRRISCAQHSQLRSQTGRKADSAGSTILSTTLPLGLNDMDEIKLWCCVEGDPNYFRVSVSPSQFIDDLKKQIYNEKAQYFARLRVGAPSLMLTKVDVAFDDVEDIISAGQYRRPSDHQPLDPMVIFGLGNPPMNISTFVLVYPVEWATRLLFATGIVHVDHLQLYKDIFMKVNKWGTFEYSNIEKNQIESADNAMTIPNFVATFEQKLVRKPRLHRDVYDVWSGLKNIGLSGPYFELVEEMRWTEQNGHRSAPGLCRNESWPISIVVKCEGVKQNEVPNQELRKYCPRSDFLISNSSLPRLLVEANSTSETSWPADLIRMLTTGAFIVRFANNFVSPFCQEKSFVLCAIFIWDNGDATRYTLYQQQVQNDEVVYYNSQDLVSLNEPVGRVAFSRHLYNLLGEELDQGRDRDAKHAIAELHRRIADRGLKSMYTEDPRNPDEMATHSSELMGLR
ncbi:hypothetical protein BC827DRAFT_1154326 [Russula dissimulans]|nr:hypothetical protein BC827DRAFT_1154326 [Russula dissimulans]